MTIYAHISLEEKRKALRKLGEVLARWLLTRLLSPLLSIGPVGTERTGHLRWSGLVVRGRVELPTFRFSGGRSYRLSYLTGPGLPGLRGPDGI